MVKTVTPVFFYFFEALLDVFEAQFFLGFQYSTISQTLITRRAVHLRFNIVKISLYVQKISKEGLNEPRHDIFRRACSDMARKENENLTRTALLLMSNGCVERGPCFTHR